MLCFLHNIITRLEDIGDTLHIVFCNLYVDERRSSVPRLTGSSTTDCDAQSKESASHIDECTEQEMPSLTESCSSQNPSPITDDEGIEVNTC